MSFNRIKPLKSMLLYKLKKGVCVCVCGGRVKIFIYKSCAAINILLMACIQKRNKYYYRRKTKCDQLEKNPPLPFCLVYLCSNIQQSQEILPDKIIIDRSDSFPPYEQSSTKTNVSYTKKIHEMQSSYCVTVSFFAVIKMCIICDNCITNNMRNRTDGQKKKKSMWKEYLKIMSWPVTP